MHTHVCANSLSHTNAPPSPTPRALIACPACDTEYPPSNRLFFTANRKRSMLTLELGLSLGLSCPSTAGDGVPRSSRAEG